MPFGARPTLVTSDGEFHTIRRQLTRLGEEGLNIVAVPAHPAETLADLEQAVKPQRVEYAPGPLRFAGATYDPTSHYRAAAVFDFHQRQGLTPERLRDINQRQVGSLKSGFEGLDVDQNIASVVNMPDARSGGFLAIKTGRARAVAQSLRARNVFADDRGDILRLGPAPYLSDQQLRDAVSALAEVFG